MEIDNTVFVAEGARLIGDGISIGKNSSIWYNSVVRCEEGRTITIGERTNIQDLCMVHVDPGYNVSIGDGVTIGHSCIIHGCKIGDNTLIGMGSVIMNGAVIGNNCVIGAGSLVTEGKVVPDSTVAFGSPVKVVKELTDQEKAAIGLAAKSYAAEAAHYKRKADSEGI